ncbi:ATP-binding protein [Vibrio sp. Of7-15]|uniref:ATP-binding protein n=1 Tax=Vibrio sp. Of7-15 TaxID=2724879 RepID=UPI001EF39D81|nr:ATP-binding protein [Vibrio sp. Of7-15]MCG7500045.1 ATP-binding protein [Vibrio sp. Of7-15]
MQPINTNNALNNGHMYAVGKSGCGKTSAAKKLAIKATDQVAIFDPLNDYQEPICGRVVRGYSSLKGFATAVMAGRKTKQGFKIAYQPTKETTPDDFDAFCRVMWACGDGKHPKALKIICEEVAEHSVSIGKATGYHGKLLRLGRKYNLHTINLFQRGQEVSKTIIDNCELACIMKQKSPVSAVYLERMTGVPAEEIKQLKNLDYILQDDEGWKKSRLRW